MTGNQIGESGAILTPEDFESTRNTELAACLITLGFPLLNSTPGFSRVIGEGIAAPGRLANMALKPQKAMIEHSFDSRGRSRRKLLLAVNAQVRISVQ